MRLPIDDSTYVLVLTGAGVSAESGVPTFRDANGLWEGHDVTQVASPEGFARDPLLVWRFYGERRARMDGIVPNDAFARTKAASHQAAYIKASNSDSGDWYTFAARRARAAVASCGTVDATAPRVRR